MQEVILNQHVTTSVQTLRALVSDDVAAVDALIRSRLYSDVTLINQLSNYIINSGGKRLRPLLVLLSARACQYQGNQHINLAAVVEFIHTATLLHDDVVDASLLRRGNMTANAVWGNEASVLVGDFLYSRAFQMMVETESMRVMEILSEATNTIAEGEVQQLLNRNNPKITEARYLEVIRNKTAKLFEASGQLAAIICRRPGHEERALANYGAYLGTAFQLVDDVLDYSATSSELGKNIGDDLAEGKPTLPLLYAMWHGTPAQKKIIREAIINGGLDNIEKIMEAIASTGAIAYTARLAEKAAAKAVKSLGIIRRQSIYHIALQSLARFALERHY